MDISKKDWKLFRERLSDWQENYMKGLVKEYVDFLNDDTKHASEKLNILVRRSRQSGVARATNPDFESHRLLLILLVSDLNHILLA